MNEEVLRIAHITRRVESLPFQLDKERILGIKDDISNNIPLELEERFYYDQIANDIMSVIKKRDDTTTAAFLIMQLPFFHKAIISSYIEAVLRDKNPVAAYFAIILKDAVELEEDNDDLISIIINHGDVPLWIESIRNIPSMPIEAIIRKVNLASNDHIALWNKEISVQAKASYNKLCDSLKTPVPPRAREPVFEEVMETEVEQTRLKKLKGKMSNPLNSIKKFKKV